MRAAYTPTSRASMIFSSAGFLSIASMNLRPGNRVLEVGVGTGIALDGYPPYAHVIAIDPSLDMLERAKKRVTEHGWGHIELRLGDALNLDYPDNSFDYVT